MSRQQIHSAPLAVASDGSIIANLHHYDGETNLDDLFRRAIADDHQVFFGTRLTASEARKLLRQSKPLRRDVGVGSRGSGTTATEGGGSTKAAATEAPCREPYLRAYSQRCCLRTRVGFRPVFGALSFIASSSTFVPGSTSTRSATRTLRP